MANPGLAPINRALNLVPKRAESRHIEQLQFSKSGPTGAGLALLEPRLDRVPLVAFQDSPAHAETSRRWSCAFAGTGDPVKSHICQGEQRPSRRAWLFGPLTVLAVSQLAAAAGSVLLAIAYPSDAPLIFGPQALGAALIAAGVWAFAIRLAHEGDDGGAADRSTSALRGPVTIGALGSFILMIGWGFYAWAERDNGWALIIGSSLGAVSLALETAAVWWVVKRMRSR